MGKPILIRPHNPSEGRTRRPEAKKSMNKLSKSAFLTRILDKQGAKKKRKAQEIAGYVQGRRTAYLRERKWKEGR